MPLPLAIPIAMAAVQSGLGLYQTLKGKKLQKEAMSDYNKDQYTIPESAISSVNLAAKQAQGNRLAGQDIMEENLAARTAQSIGAAKRAASTPSQVLAATVQSYANQQAQQQQIDLAAMEDYQRRQQMYANTLQSLSPYVTEAWKYRTLYPTQAKLNAASAFSGVGQQNIGQGIQSGLNMFMNQQYIKGLGQQGQSIQPQSTAIIQQPIQQFDYWGGGQPDNSIKQRQGNY